MDISNTPLEINILTLNCWGLKYLAKFRNERLIEIGRRIAGAEPIPHIVGLQECWTHEDYQHIRRETKHILPYGKLYHSGIFGGGLVILSKWPIEESSMFRYPLNGRPTAFFRGDWFVGKGVACAHLRFGQGVKDVIEVFTTHLHAPYEKEPNDSYICHRTAQAWEISKLFRGAAERGHLVVGLGDFNMTPQSLAHRLITSHSPVEDAWLSLHPGSSLGAAQDPIERARRKPVPTAHFNLIENGITCDSVLNTWRWSKDQQKMLGVNKPLIEVPLDTIDPKGKRLDYIFVGSQSNPGLLPNGRWVVSSAKVGMTSRHPELQCSLSDHFSVQATLGFSQEREKNERRDFRDLMDDDDAFLKSSEPSLHKSDKVSSRAALLNTYDEVLGMIYKYRSRERRQRRLRLGHFSGSLMISIGCLFAICWNPPRFIAFALVLVSTLGLSAGVIDGLIGGLFIGSEIRALKEFEWEISNARAAACGEPHYMADESVIDW
ncbi:hypothetical protein K3495_g6715 [Podosphaera aphanis]|nr:hypothetical protein K3495_g6715 [Podosphaera aphanis]